MPLIWDLYATAYDVINKNEPYKNLLSDVVKFLDLKPGLKILNIGCGTGNLENMIQKSEVGAEITGVDSSWEMLRRATKKLNTFKNIHFIHADLNKPLDFEDNAFDRVVAVNSVYATNKPVETINEMFRVLKPGGKIVIADPKKGAEIKKIVSEQRKILGAGKFLFKTIVNLPALLVIGLVNKLYIKNMQNNFFDSKGLEKLLYSLGMENIKMIYSYADQNILISATKK